MADALQAKGYPYQFVFADNVAHVSRPVELQSMPEAFEWTWKGYRAGLKNLNRPISGFSA
jgi:hypothetical protein